MLFSASILLLALPITGVEASSNQVLVLTSGHAMTVKSFRVDGPVLRIVDKNGEPMIIRGQADMERSREATARLAQLETHTANRLEELEMAERRQAARARAERNDSVLAASRRARATGRRSGISTAISSSESAPAPGEAGIVAATSTARTVGVYNLSPGQVRKVTIDADAPLQVSYRAKLTDSERKDCVNGCIGFTDGENVVNEVQAAFKSAPTDGKVTVTLENVELFPISVELYRE